MSWGLDSPPILFVFRIDHPKTSSAEAFSLFFDDLTQVFGGVFSKLHVLYPFANETPILDESRFLLKKSSKQARSSSS